MRLKKLQMQGFKSFADRTEIQFDQNIVAIVGPNGCGKSNIVDAIRWTMGEQSAKGLRGKDMADVIFAGTPSRKAAGYAEASLIFDNQDKTAPAPYTDVSEIMVTRRLYRSGESEYLINNVQVRLKDIHDLFLGTGSSAKAYSIVAQGKVDQVVLAKPEDRRILIEEAAGIAKYKVRKQAAERKMEATNQNLARVQDILRELERNAKSLERQVERAEKFRELQKNLRDIDSRVIAAKVRYIDRKAIENEESLEAAKDELQKTSTLLAECEAKLEKARLESLNYEKLSGSEIEKLMAHKEQVSRLQTELELGIQKVQILENQIQEREKDIERLKGKSRDQAEQQEKLKEELQSLEAQKLSKTEELESLRRKVEEAESLRKSREEILQGHLDELEKLRTAAAREAQRREMLQAERVDLELQRAGIEARLENLDSERKEKTQDLESLQSELSRSDQKLKADEAELANARSQYESLLHSQQEMSKALAEAEIHEADILAQLESLKTLEEHHVGYEAGALEFKEKTGHPLFLDRVKFRAEFRELGEILMSHFGQAYLGSEEGLPQIEARWHRLILGEAPSFSSHCAQFLSESVDPEITEVLRRIEYVDQIDTTKAHAQLSRSGEFWAPVSEGLFIESRGQLKRDESPFGRIQEREELQTRLQDAQSNIENSKKNLMKIEQDLNQCRVHIKSLEEAVKEVRTRLHAFERQVFEKQQALTRIEATCEQLKSDIEKTDLRLNELHQELSSQVDESDLNEAIARVENSRAELAQSQKQKAEAEAAWVEFRIAYGALSERIERLRQQCVTADMTQSEYAHNESVFQTDIRLWKEEIEGIHSRRSDLQAQLSALNSEIENLEKSLAQTKEKLSLLHRELDEGERERKSLQSLKEEQQQRSQDLEIERRELRHQVEELSQILQERYQMNLEDLLQSVSAEAIADLEEPEALEKLENEASILRDRLSKFGDVNLVALQEYEEIKSRLDFMNNQREDLLKTLDALQSIIQRINKITEFRFRETFKAINHNFQILFPKLFGGGKAFMKLTDENNLLDTGIEIFAEPPGKKVQAMSLLSGGEKAMTSISLLFSLFAYRPSSFCILDEVDAPLDDINTRRYNEIIQEMSSLSQFIVITHNKRTMEVASTLFGITMQEPGCSRIVGVNLQEARTFTGDAA